MQVEAGTDQAQIVPAKGTIQSREPFDLSAMLQRMSDTVDLVSKTIVDLKSGIDDALGSVTDTAMEAQELINDVGDRRPRRSWCPRRRSARISTRSSPACARDGAPSASC